MDTPGLHRSDMPQHEDGRAGGKPNGPWAEATCHRDYHMPVAAESLDVVMMCGQSAVSLLECFGVSRECPRPVR